MNGHAYPPLVGNASQFQSQIHKKNNYFQYLIHSRLRYHFWNKGIEDYVALDVDVYSNLLLINFK